jgi:hypothetical protein
MYNSDMRSAQHALPSLRSNPPSATVVHYIRASSGSSFGRVLPRQPALRLHTELTTFAEYNDVRFACDFKHCAAFSAIDPGPADEASSPRTDLQRSNRHGRFVKRAVGSPELSVSSVTGLYILLERA